MYIYVLRLISNKFYIGKSITPISRIEQHFSNGGASWTRKYPPIEVCEIIENCDDFDEDKYTKIYMKKYGIDNVRGGTFCQHKLPKDIQTVLQKMIWGASNKCFKCGSTTHWSKDCFEVSNQKSRTVEFIPTKVRGKRKFKEIDNEDIILN